VLTRERLDDILRRLPSLRLVVVGDFFLDRYLVTDPDLSETSLETGLEARQVVEVRSSPGAAGTVTNNLAALGVGRLHAVGLIGEDGEGYELRRGLAATGVETSGLLARPDRFTPTYMKPMVREGARERELERLDIKNRRPMDREAEEAVIASLNALAPEADGMVLADQVQERNCGVLTDRMREHIRELAARHPALPIVADSRMRIGEYRGVMLKPNSHEAFAACGRSGAPEREMLRTCGTELAERTGRPVFITLGPDGMLVCMEGTCRYVPGIAVEGPIDIVGAGDSAMAGIVSALAAGAAAEEAAALGNLCASVTVTKLGTTGTASPEELRARL
jgi:rfaE bifunctional protein kinase chain/domain